MYNRDQLIIYDYFKEVLDGHRISDVLDPLTGLVSRVHMVRFVKSLMSAGMPFTFGMIDLDNFKYINDTYGHFAGDEMLMAVSAALQNFLAGYGIVGRFGGDEFLFVNLRDLEYADKKNFCRDLFGSFSVLRRTFHVGEYELFITGTAGMATYPHDAEDYTELFSMIDKTLYRGKSKGRNCYIIYTPEKHKNIEIIKLKKNRLYDTFKNLAAGFDSADDIYDKMRAVYASLMNDLHITNLYYAGRKKELKSVIDMKNLGSVSDIDLLMKDEVYSTNDISQIRKVSPFFYQVLAENEVEAVLVMRINDGRTDYGYLVCAEPHTLRIWQEDEFAVMFLFARLVGGFLSGKQLVLE
ncbi:MAG: GGDEF domain-containing protein [Anaerolineaceae bacterium]|nr:GGDEF domain-containing protein [Anaerolineaceae bacterium]